MWLPRAKTHPAKLSFTILVPTDHVIAATILLYGHMTFGAFLQSIGRVVIRNRNRQVSPALKKGQRGKQMHNISKE